MNKDVVVDKVSEADKVRYAATFIDQAEFCSWGAGLGINRRPPWRKGERKGGEDDRKMCLER